MWGKKLYSWTISVQVSTTCAVVTQLSLTHKRSSLVQIQQRADYSNQFIFSIGVLLFFPQSRLHSLWHIQHYGYVAQNHLSSCFYRGRHITIKGLHARRKKVRLCCQCLMMYCSALHFILFIMFIQKKRSYLRTHCLSSILKLPEKLPCPDCLPGSMYWLSK